MATINVEHPVKEYWLKKLRFLMKEDMIKEYIVRPDKIIVSVKGDEQNHVYPNCTRVKKYFIRQQNEDFDAMKEVDLQGICGSLEKLGMKPSFVILIGMKVYAAFVHVPEDMKQINYAIGVNLGEYARIKKEWIKETGGIYGENEYKPA